MGARLVFSDGSPDILAYPQDAAAWGRLARLLTIGKDRAEKGDCIFGLAGSAGDGEGLNLIVMPPERIDADALIEVLRRFKETSRRSVWLGASLLYRGDDRRRSQSSETSPTRFVPLIAVNDVLYHAPERRRTTGRRHLHPRASDPGGGGRLLGANAERHLKSPEEMTRLFRRGIRRPSSRPRGS